MVSLSTPPADFNTPQSSNTSPPQLSPVSLGWSTEDRTVARAHLVDVFEDLLAFHPTAKERLEQDTLWLQDSSAERLQVVAEALAKSVVLDYYEQRVFDLFYQIKPFTTATRNPKERTPKEKELLRYIGGTLLIQQKMLGIVEVGDKPDQI